MMRFPKLLAFAAGLASATGFAPLDLWPVTIAAFALWMWLVAGAPDLRGAMARGWWFGVGHFTVGMNWIAGSFRYQETMPVWLGGVAVVVLALYLALYPAVAAGLAWRWGRPRRVVYVLIFAAAWIVTEYLRATLFSGFAWNPLGVIMVPTTGDGLAKLVGTYGLSGLVIVIAGALRHPRRLIAVPAALAGVLGGGWLVIAIAGDPGRSDRLVRVVQPNIGQQTKHDETFDEVNWAKLASLTGVPGPQPRLILWPEAAVPYFLEEEVWARDRIARLMGPKDMILTGGDAFIWDKAGKNIIAARNSLFAVTSVGSLIGRYDKAHLVPYGEYLPMRPLLSAIGLSRLVPGDIDFWPGPGPRSIALPGFGKVGVQICYEIIFSGEVIDPENRPDFLFNPSNDSWFGAWGSPQFVAQARLRAIEEGMPVVRATPTGISAVIDSNGAVLVALPIGKAGMIQTTLPKVAAPTLFARFGNILPFGFALMLVGLAVALRRWHR
jgi:apolipoprotein N-acyltransferase